MSRVPRPASHPCDYCGGPLAGPGHAGRPWPGRAAAAYCCFGCLSLGEQRWQEAAACGGPACTISPPRKIDGLAVRLAVGVVVVGQSMAYGLALNLHDDVSPGVRWWAQAAILAATLLIGVLLGGPLLRAAWREVRAGRLTIEALFLLTMAGAMGASLQAHVTGRGPIYYEVVSILLVVYTLGKLIGARSRAAAVASSRAWAGQLETCRVVGEGGRTRAVPAADVRAGDVVEVHPGETVAVDGVVREGVGFVSEAAVSGEPFAAVRRPGDRVLAGSASHDATFRIEATAAGTEREVDRLLAAVEAARDRPLSLQRRADAVGRAFLPLVVLVALGTFAYWTWFTPAGWEAGLFNAMSVLLVACPCVIGLATPVVLWSALGRLAERGVIVRGGDAVERLAAVDRVVFDKTGTLTDERFTLLDIVTAATGDDRARLLGWLAAVQRQSKHPVAAPFAALPTPFGEARVLNLRAVPGCGVAAEVEADDGTRHTLHIGRPEWVRSVLVARASKPGVAHDPGLGSPGHENATPPSPPGCATNNGLAARLRSTAGHRIEVALDGGLAAVAVVAERLRDSAAGAMADFRRLGLPVEVLTGDTAERAAALGLTDTRGSLRPDDKRRRVDDLVAAGGKPLVVGDGINDASALAAAHVGVALASGTDLAVGAAAVTLYQSDLRALPWAVAVSREAVRAVRRNLLRALAYNAVGMALAAGGVLHPVAAVLLMVLSSLSLVFASTRVGVVPDHCGDEVEEDPPVAAGGLSPKPFVHAFAFALQGVALLLLLDTAREPVVAAVVLGGFALVGGCLAWVWHRWAAIPHGLDMAFGMLTAGNLGMLLGWWADLGFGPVHCLHCCACGDPLASPGMWAGMLLFANAAMLGLARRPASHGRDHAAAMYTGGNVGMAAGMVAGGWLAALVDGNGVEAVFALHLAGMTAGMLAGMFAGTWLVERVIAGVRSLPAVRSWLSRPPNPGKAITGLSPDPSVQPEPLPYFFQK